MIDSITVTNSEAQKEIKIEKGSFKFVLDSIDWDTPSVQVNDYRVPFQIGTLLTGMVVGTRQPSIIGYVVADTTKINTLGKTWNEYFEEQRQEINDNKQELDKVFSIYQDVIIKAGDYYLKARPSMPVKYADEEEDNNEVLCKFSVSFTCFEPMFYKESKHVDLAATTNMFRFPLILTENTKDEYVVFGNNIKRKSMLVVNDGDIEVGCKIIIRANGGVVSSPKVYNVNTGDFIELQGIQLQDGDYITITTEVGEENVVWHIAKGGTDNSLIGWIQSGSKFLKIPRGESFYAYESSDEDSGALELYIEYTEKFFNIRGM